MQYRDRRIRSIVGYEPTECDRTGSPYYPSGSNGWNICKCVVRYEPTQCDRTGPPYYPSGSNGWNISCPGLTDILPTLSPGMACSMSDICTGVDCCVDVELLGRSFHTYIDIDPCYYRMTVGVEKMEFNTSLMDYTWGSVIEVALYGVVKFRLTLDDLYEENLYLINLNISVCFEAKGPCAIDSAIVLKNSLIPKTHCNFSHGFDIAGFSIDKWLTDRNMNNTKVLPNYVVSQMMEYLDLSSYLHGTPCNRKIGPWSPNFDGWMRECKQPLSLPYLKETETTCIVEDTCTGVRCCVEMSLLDRSFEYSVRLDACSFMLTVGVEKLTYKHSLIDYKYGKKSQFYINGVFKIDYIIEELQSSNEFLLSVNLSICLETTYCVINRTVAENVRLPKPNCNWNTGYKIPGFSLQSWMTDKHFAPRVHLPEYAILQLVKDLGVAGYLKDTPCNRTSGLYTPTVQGWKTECPITTVRPNLQSGINCNLLSSCTSVDCCVDVDIIGHSVNTVLELDPCDQRLTIGIDNLVFNVSLYDFNWATVNRLYMYNVFRIDYAIYDLVSDHQYLVEMNFNVCFESSSPCMFVQPIFSNTRLAKKPCDWQTGFINQNFSVTNWKKEHDIDVASQLSPIEISKLKETLGIAPYLKDKACQRYNPPYSPPLNGWRTECSTHLKERDTLPFNINCYIGQICTDVLCCIDVDLLGTSMETEVKIDPCDFMLTVRIEKLTFEVTLFDYQWGKQEYFDLYGVVLMFFSIDNLYEEKKYLINMNLTTSFEAGGPVNSHVVIFENYLLPKQVCQWHSDYFIKGFSLYSWMTGRGFKPTDMLPNFMLYQLYEETNLAPYFLDDKCDRGVQPYHNGWSQDCAMNMTLPNIKSEVACNILDTCTGLQCCVHNAFLKQTFDVSFQLDPCENRLSIGIEKTMYNRTLTDFKWGEDNFFSLQGIVRVLYNIENLYTERMYLIDMKIMFCYETSIPQCDDNNIYTVLENTRLPKQHCDWTGHSSASGFSLSRWYTEYGLAPGAKLEDWMISHLLNDLSISSYLNTRQCRRSDAMFSHGTDGWNKACVKSVSLPSIPGPTSCHLTDDCTSVECCMDVDFIPRSFGFYLHIDPCTYEMTVGIEKFRKNISLTNYKWGKQEDLWLVGVFHLSFIIEDLPGERIFVVSINMSTCFEDGQTCDVTQILDKSRLPKDLCTWDTSYYVANFSLRNWKGDNNMDPYKPLPEYGQSLLFEKMGISPHLQKEQCNSNTAKFNHTVWTDACPLNTSVSWTMTSDVGIPCHLSSLCTGIECCLRSDYLLRDFHTRVIVDPCQFVVSVGIENFIHNISLAKFEFGKLRQFSFGGAISIFFTIDKIKEEHAYLMSLNMSVCTESHEPCDQHYEILNNVLLPILQCPWQHDFNNANFSLSDWMTDHQLSPGQQLSENMASKLFQYLGLSYYLKSPSCSRSSSPYSPSVNGWNKLCSSNTTSVGSLTDPISCYLDYTCAAVDCCVDVDKLGRTMMTSLSVDNCHHKLTLQLERLTREISLLNYTWGTQEEFSLMGVLRANLTIHDLAAENNYLVNLNIHVCFETRGTCVFSTSILSDVKLPKMKCDWAAGQEFYLNKWLSEKGLTKPVGNDILPEWAVYQLREDLGISRYLYDQPCYNVTSQFTESDDGWNSDCPKDMILPDISGQGVVCSVPSTCTTLECCIDTPLLHTSIQTSLSIHNCRNSLHLQIEKLQIKIKLDEVSYGVENTFSLFGAVSIIYQIDKLDMEKAYQLNVNLSVCYETGEPCQLNLQVFNNTILNQTTCNLADGFIDKTFSLTSWLTSQGLPPSVPSNDVTTNDLIIELGLDDYMGHTSRCDLSAYPYSPAIKGWNNECSNITTTRPDLTGDIACHIPSTCSSVSCCVQVDRLRRSLYTAIDLNTCQYTLTVTIEGLQHEIELLNYQWGTSEEIQLHGVFRLKFTVHNIPSQSKFTVDVDISICFEATATPCSTVYSVMKTSDILHAACDTSQNMMLFKGLSFDFWKLTECMVAPRTNVTTGCPTAANGETFQCCMPLTFRSGRRNVFVKFTVSSCDEIQFGVERKQWTQSGLQSMSGNTVSENLGESFQLNYTLQNHAASVTLTVSIQACYLAQRESCQVYQLTPVNGLIINKPACSGKKRKKRELVELDPTDFVGGLRRLTEKKASSDEIQEYVEKVKNYEHAQKMINLAGGVISDGDSKVGAMSALNALGKNNPAAIVTVGDMSISHVDGGDIISDMMGTTTDGRCGANQAFVVGKGLTGAGVRLLGNKLAKMTIGDLAAMFDMKNIDPVLIIQLGDQIKDLAKALLAEFIDTIMNGNILNIFSSFDVPFEADFSFPKQTIKFFPDISISYPLGGFLTISFGFGSGAYYGMKFVIGAKLMSMKGYAEVIPYGGVTVWGELGIGFLLYGKLRIEGRVMDLRFPTRAEISFNKFPLDVGMSMYLKLVPVKILLQGLVTLEFNFFGIQIKKTLFKYNIWSYTAPTISAKLVDTFKDEPDNSPPQMGSFTDPKPGSKPGSKPETPHNPTVTPCQVRQLKGLDYTEPRFEISVRAADDRCQVKLFLDVGTVPGGSDVLKEKELGGQSTVVKEKLKATGVPLYFTVIAENDSGQRAKASCSLPTYDVTLPGGRFQEEYTTSSNPAIMRALVTVYEDSELKQPMVGLGFGKDIFGDQIINWNYVTIEEQQHEFDLGDDPFNHKVLEKMFTGSRTGRLIAPKAGPDTSKNSPGDCARACANLPHTKCMSFNYDFGKATCELVEGIDGHDYKLSISGLFQHYERLGIGKAKQFVYTGLKIQHNKLHYFNFMMVNVLGYRSIITSKGILVDLTTPLTGLIKNNSTDYLEIINCLDLIPEHDRPDWKIWCKGVNTKVKNHRLIIDGEGSLTVFNGPEPMTDLRYTRANRYIAANWDGFNDKESGLLGYTITVGKQHCEDLIHPHHDPHKHLFDKSQWTNTAMISPIPAPYTILPDGTYYVTVRALNDVKYGGPLATTVCHTTPYVVDNSPPFVWEIFDIKYNEDTYELTAKHNSSDPDSGLESNDLCFGHTTRDCDEMEWDRLTFNPNISYNWKLSNGIPIWLKIKAVNRVDLRTIGVADQAIIIDTTPPVNGTVNDGPLYGTDLLYTKDFDSLCANWLKFYDPESGIAFYMVSVGSVPDINVTDIANITQYNRKTHKTCVELPTGHYLEHGKTYYTTVWAYNGGIKQRNCVGISNGVTVDLTKPDSGQVIDGNLTGFNDMKFSPSPAKVEVQWRNYYDPESTIRLYDVQVERASNLTDDYTVIRDWVKFSNDTTSVKWLNFHLKHKDKVKVNLKTTNGALNTIINSTDGFVVDQTPPVLLSLGDGSIFGKDIEFQSEKTELSTNFKFTDEESGLDHYKFQIYQRHQGITQQIVPTQYGSWLEVHDDITMTTYTHTGMSLKQGGMYSIRVGAVNKAGFVAAFDTSGVVIDTEPPVVHWLKVGTLSDGHEEDIDGYVWQADVSGIKAAWDADDHQSGVVGYKIAVGTSKGGTDILPWTDYGTDMDVYITGLTLSVSDESTHSPVYYVSLKARNGAGLESDPVISTPIMVVDEDEPGIVVDGADRTETPILADIGEDIDYQSDMSTVSVQFTGFQSHLHGLKAYKWSVGTTPGGEDVQPFMTHGILHKEEKDVGGTGCSGAMVDIVIILDTSSSVGKENYQKMKNFCKDFLKNADLDSGNVRVGILAYSTRVYVEFYLNTYDSSQEIMSAIDAIPYRHGYTNTADALKTMRTKLYSEANGDRKNVSDVAILLTDGLSTINKHRTVLEAERARAEGIHIYAVSITVTDTREVEAIASVPATENCFSVQDFGELAALSDDIFEAFCPGIKTSSGYAQTTLPLEPETTYYTTIRGITNAGNVIEATSDGFTVDTTPPNILVDRLTGFTGTKHNIQSGGSVYQKSADSLSAMWHYNDTESSIERAWYSVGTYPYAEDVSPRKEVEVSSVLLSELKLASVAPDVTGKPNILNIWAENKAGLISHAMSGGVIIDTTPPGPGKVQCPEYVGLEMPIQCKWTGFLDIESPIEKFNISMGSSQGADDILAGHEVSGYTSLYSIQGVNHMLEHGKSYYVTVTAINTVDMETYAFSGPVAIDTTPPVYGKVVDLHTTYRIDVRDNELTVKMNAKICDTDEECDTLDATCSESLSSVTATWQRFYDEESEITGLQIALGTTPGGGQIKPFFDLPLEAKYYTIGGLDLMGLRKVYVSIKGTNGAGLSSVATSNGLYLSYISQGLPPLLHIGVFDVLKGSHGDVNFQESFDTYRASWDVSGDPCPVVKYEWQIQRLDGLVVQEWLDVGVKTSGMNDELHMKNGELYYSLLRVTNALNYTYIIRSDGVTIEQDPLLPGKVFDGDITGYDLNYMPSKTMVSANWDGFGLPAGALSQVDVISGNPGIHVDQEQLEEQADNQQVAFYEVAMGTDRRFPKARDNIVPFTNVGKNKTVTFYNLDLVPGTGLYYFTVRAYSASYSVALVTSNGFHVGFDGGVTPGTIIMNDYINTDTHVDVQFEGFTSKLDILMYYIALSNNTDANGTDCKQYIDGGSATEEESHHLFSIYPVSNINKNTFYRITSLQLDQGHTYYVYVMGTDKAGECGMTYHPFTVDITPPQPGRIKAGPDYDMPVTFTSDNSTIKVTWENFDDPESDIDTFEVSLWKNSSCYHDNTEELLVDWIELTRNYTEYSFVELGLKKNTPYTVKFRVTNKAGLSMWQYTSPVLYDVSHPTAGRVIDGTNFTDDQVWFSSSTTVKGTLLHLASPFGPACPSRHISMVNDPQWTKLQQIGFKDPSGEKWGLIHRKENIDLLTYDKTVTIKLARDNHKRRMFTGALYRSADYQNGGTYQVSIKAAGGEGIAVTGIMLWDGPEDGIATYNYKEDEDWTKSMSQCCLLDPIPQDCLKVINCTVYMANKYRNSTLPTVPPTTTTASTSATTSQPYHVVNNPDGSVVDTPIDTSTPIAQTSCGVQIYSGESPHIVTWCRTYNDSYRIQKTSIPIYFDPSAGFHRYKIMIFPEKDDAVNLNWCITVFVDKDQLTKICGISPLSTSTKLVMHVWNRDNYIPEITDMFNVFSTKAYFKDLVMPPAPGSLCRYGDPFRGGTNSIIRYEVGLGSDKLLTDIAPFREVVKPCIPCYTECSKYNCDETCQADKYVDMTFTLDNLDLKSVAVVKNESGHLINKTLTYFFTVKAVLGSGISEMASSDGFYVDLTPPVFDPDVMRQIYIDVSQGEFTPVIYQASNNTIKALWRCYDEESLVKENLWAIGTTIGGEELQPFQSVGMNSSAINTTFEGILQHNHTYYVTIICINGGDQAAQWRDSIGVTVLLEPPLVDDINNTIPGAKEFPHPVTPSDAKESTDPTSIGFTFTASEDKSITRYDMCIGTSEDNDDIFPCMWVGYNESGSAMIKNGYLYINGHKIRPLSELRPPSGNSSDNSSNVFHMEPGRTLFMTMRVCNDAMLCTNKSLGSITITDKKTVLETSVNGEAIKLIHSLKSNSTRGKRAADALTVLTPEGLKPGQSIMMQPLQEKELTMDYRSDSSPHFQSYIVDPETTSDMVERLLYRRSLQSLYSFALVPVGHLSMPGPVNITYSDIIGDNKENKTELLHWNPVLQQWEITSRTCGYNTETDNGDGTISVMICNTWREYGKDKVSNRRRRSATSHKTYLSSETQFILVSLAKGVYNSPPRLLSPNNLRMEEDAGTLQYKLIAMDEEGEEIMFETDNNFTDYNMGTPLLSHDGILLYTPCKDCFGTETIPVVMTEIQADPEIPAADAHVTLTLSVEEINDPPFMFITQYGQSLLDDDPTEPIKVYLEQMNDFNKEKWSTPFSAVVGAFDTEKNDTLVMESSGPVHGNPTLKNKNTSTLIIKQPCPPNIKMDSLPCGDFIDFVPYDEDTMSWIYMTLGYDQNMSFFGHDQIKLYVNDSHNATSPVITIDFIIMESPCHNGGVCQAKNHTLYPIYPCNDSHRADSFDTYYDCQCKPGYTGIHCETEMDACLSSPCTEPYVCHSLINGYKCDCPEDNAMCDFKPWIVAVGVVAGLMFICIVFVALCRRKVRQRKKVHDSMTTLKSQSSEESADDIRTGSLVFMEGKSSPLDDVQNESSVDQNLITFPDLDDRVEQHKGKNQHFQSNLLMFNTSVGPIPDKPSTKPVFDIKTLHHTDLPPLEIDSSIPDSMLKHPDDQSESTVKQNLITFPDKNDRPQPPKGNKRHFRSEFPLFRTSVGPEPDKQGSNSDPLEEDSKPSKTPKPKVKDLKGWTPDFSSHELEVPRKQTSELNIERSSGQIPKTLSHENVDGETS